MTDTTVTRSTAQIIDTYLEAYSEPDPTRRRELIAGTFAEGAVLADPPMAARGRSELDTMFAAVQAQFPGHRFRRTTAIDEHHGCARYGWELVGPDAAPAVAGVDIVEVDAEGQITKVTGFFGDLVPLAD